MGEAKRKRNRSCPCGSGKRAGDCCRRAGQLFRPPAQVVLTRLPEVYSHLKCYLREVGCCSDRISGEHPLSRSVLKLIDPEKVVVGGFPWQGAEARQSIGIGNLTAKVLCEAHNNALNDIDAAARQFFSALKTSESRQTAASRHYLISGHDLERWMLKALVGLTAAGVFRDSRGTTLQLTTEIDVPKLLAQPLAWQHTAGLYLAHKVGDAYPQVNTVEMAALVEPSSMAVIGMTMRIKGMQFVLFLQSRASLIGSSLQDAWYRPSVLTHRHTHVEHRIELSWHDIRDHFEVTLNVHNERPPGANLSIEWPFDGKA